MSEQRSTTATITPHSDNARQGNNPPPAPGPRPGPVERLSRWLRRLGRPRVWVACAAAFMVAAFVFFASSAPFAVPEVEAACGQAPPDMRFYTSATDVTGFLDACGPAGRTAYRNMQLADLIYPSIVGVFLASSLALVIGRISRRRSNVVSLAALPLVASSFDYLENLFAWFALARYPSSAPTDSVLGFASAAKTVTSWGSGILLLGAIAMLALQFVGRHRRSLQP